MEVDAALRRWGLNVSEHKCQLYAALKAIVDGDLVLKVDTQVLFTIYFDNKGAGVRFIAPT